MKKVNNTQSLPDVEMKLEGDIGFDHASVLQRRLIEASQTGSHHILNLMKVTSLDLTSCQLILAFKRKMELKVQSWRFTLLLSDDWKTLLQINGLLDELMPHDK